MRENFKNNIEGAPLSRRRKGKSFGERIESFDQLIKGWMTAPEGVDYCPRCWGVEKQTMPFSKQAEDAPRPTVEFAEKRKGTDDWSAICQKCGTEVSATRR